MQRRWFFICVQKFFSATILSWPIYFHVLFTISCMQHWGATFCMWKLTVPSQKADSEETEAKLIESLVPITTSQISIKPAAGESSYNRIFLTLHSLSLSLLTTNHRHFLSHWSIDNYERTRVGSLSPFHTQIPVNISIETKAGDNERCQPHIASNSFSTQCCEHKRREECAFAPCSEPSLDARPSAQIFHVGHAFRPNLANSGLARPLSKEATPGPLFGKFSRPNR